jgi:hypothetical protein
VRIRLGRAKKQSQRPLVFQGMRALITHGDTKSDISKRSPNVAKAAKSITGDKWRKTREKIGFLAIKTTKATPGEK